MLVCLDVGNTHIVLGVYNNEELKTYRICTNPNATSDELGIKIKEILNFNYKNATKYDFVISSVVPKIDLAIKKMCAKYFNCEALFVEQGVKSGIKIRLDNPKELGADILVGAVASVSQYGGNCLVIDIGTAMTMVYVNENKELLGGTIFPGMHTSFSSLMSKAAKLEEVSFEKPKDIIGTDTKSCLQSGMIYGYLSLIEGLIEMYKKRLGEFKVVITGGEAALLKEFFKDKDYIFDDELVLLAEDGGNFGSKERPIAYRVSGKCWVNNHAHVLKPKKEMNVDYLCYSLMFYNVEGIINGATRQKLTQSAMRKMKIPIRGMEEQLKIVEKLNKIISIKEKRKQELYTSNPELREIDNKLSEFSINTAKCILQNNSKEYLENLKKEVQDLKNKKINILKKVGLSEDYLLPIYDCKICKDTGYVFENGQTKMCNCLKQKLYNIEYNEKNMTYIKNQTFDNFNINLFSNEVDEKKYNSKISPRENIIDIKNAAVDFINNFDDENTKNLIFSGGTGLGKTFLSNCIVNELLEKGKTVMYQTAPVMLDSLISDLFAKPENQTGISKNLLSVDLLVIDDLGTENLNSMKFTELYKIINTRLLTGKTKTIISTNLDLRGLFKTYDERLASRFVGYYDIYRFYGDDIRLKK